MEYRFNEQTMKDIERQGGIYNQEIMTDVRKAYAQGYEGLPPSDKYQPQYKRGYWIKPTAMAELPSIRKK